MAGINKVFILGRLGKDPERRVANSGTVITSFSVATSEMRGGDGQREEKTEWHNIVSFGKTAELCAQYLAKGRQVFIEGRIQTRDYMDKDNNKRYITEIVANNVQFVGERGAGAGSGMASSNDAPAPGPSSMPDSFPPMMNTGAMDDDIPF